MRLLDEVLQHLLGDGKIGNDAVLERANSRDMPGGPAEHVLRFDADRLDGLAAAPRLLADRDHRRLVEHDATPPDIDQGVGRTEIDGQIVGEMSEKTL